MKENRKQDIPNSFKPLLFIMIGIVSILFIYDLYNVINKPLQTTIWIFGFFFVKYVSISTGMFYFLLIINMVLANKILYKGEYRKSINAIKNLQKDAITTQSTFFGKLIYIVFAIIIIGLYLILKVNYILYSLLIPTFTILWISLRMKQPPSVIYLSSSSNKMNIYYHYDLKMFISPLRMVSFLEYDRKYQYEKNKLSNTIYLDVLRTVFNEDWKDNLNTVLDNIKVIIMDTLHPTIHTKAEVEMIVEKQYLYKTFFLTNKDKETPLINETIHLMQNKVDSEVCIGDYNNLFRCLKSIFYDKHYLSSEYSMIQCMQNSSKGDNFNYKSTACETLVNNGNHLLDQRKFIDAESLFKEALHCTIQKQEIIWTNLSIISLNLSNFNDAENHILRALQINVNHPNTLYTAGLVYEMLKNKVKAIRFYEKFLLNTRFKNKKQLLDAEFRLKKLKNSIY